MKIQTKYHGKVEITEQDIWTFENGIPGFQDEKQFTILQFPDNDVFFILQSIQTATLGFVITNPFQFFKEYDIKIDDNTIEQLQIEKETDVLVYTILTVQDPFANTTANLQAPLIMNKNNQKAKQLILTDSQYKTRHKILQKG
ncbi:flagellar assembly factor FliW [Oikeobacillus pervagus]|uniref:Flagellar assembly factor FliW n=1 Tax=Oikeobacillus pervagus TaxID=1325931 RepID=A0AAJ1WJ04_9BACI|nr:flagellar assembly protein FliW [Oikeobacillus pervagus]MDQ0214953.1 flagellar assembly factor FliW [Oikeobacillus pervagus]